MMTMKMITSLHLSKRKRPPKNRHLKRWNHLAMPKVIRKKLKRRRMWKNNSTRWVQMKNKKGKRIKRRRIKRRRIHSVAIFVRSRLKLGIPCLHI